MVAADGVILGAPTYITNIPSNMQAFIERASLVSRANGGSLRRKVGAAVIAARRGGAIHAYDTLNHFFHLNQMIVPGSIYWNIGIGREKGEVEKDTEGIETMKVLGQNMAWLLKRLHK
jgi:multimeric flavodoxin WrbA